MNVLSRYAAGVAMTLSVISGSNARADAIDTHPNADQLKRIFAAPAGDDFKSTGVTRADYLKLIAGNVDFFKKYQDEKGAIIDPVSKGERQYSTPAFAVAAGVLVKEAGRKDLLDAATRATSCALTALIEMRPADKHADFYIPLLVHAYRFLKDGVPPEQSAAWAEQFKKIDPETMYRADLRHMNWNIVSSSGELLRRKDGLVAKDQLGPQMAYLEECLAGHLDTFTSIGLCEDPGAPMAYDAFSRLWLEDFFADDAYDGPNAPRMRDFLRTGGLSTLLLLSPTGEWATGGRSGLHNWTDAEVVAVCEINAVHWKKDGCEDVAGAFKRAAHLAFQSVARWQRPGGEIWIIKNRAEPETRLAYEGYSNHSQYNLLPMAMLGIAYSRADDSISEKPSPSEVGGYVFDARKIFHKIAAAAGGYYVLIDTAADPHYNATGLQRVHRAGVLYPALSDSAAGERAYGPDIAPKAAIAPGIEWKAADPDAKWIGLADFSGEEEKPSTQATKPWTQSTEPAVRRIVKSVRLEVESPDLMDGRRVAFDVVYSLAGSDADPNTVNEHYLITAKGVDCLSATFGGEAPAEKRLRFPALVSDGATDTLVKLSAKDFSISERGSTTLIEVSPEDALSGGFKLDGPRVVGHNGYLQEVVAGLQTSAISWKITLSQEPEQPKK